MDLLNKTIRNLIATAAGNVNVIAAQKQLVKVAELIGSPYDPATTPDDGATTAGQIPVVKGFLEGTLITGAAAKENLAEAYALLTTVTQTIPT